MKKYSLVIMGAAMLASSCTTGAGAGAYAGGSIGSVLGSAIGGIIGGPHGSDVGTLFGMAGGAVVGGVVGDAADRQQRQEQSEVLARRNQRIQREKAERAQTQQQYNDGYGYGAEHSDNIDPSQMVDNSNSGDDRIDFSAGQAPSDSQNDSQQDGQDAVPSVDASHIEQLYGGNATSTSGRLDIRNVVFTDTSADNVLHGGEYGKVVFEIYNNTDAAVYNFEPSVVEADGNKRIYISPSVRVERIDPGQGLRYTATVKADSRVKTGQIRLLVSVQKDGKPISYVTVVKVNTVRK